MTLTQMFKTAQIFGPFLIKLNPILTLNHPLLQSSNDAKYDNIVPFKGGPR